MNDDDELTGMKWQILTQIHMLIRLQTNEAETLNTKTVKRGSKVVY